MYLSFQRKTTLLLTCFCIVEGKCSQISSHGRLRTLREREGRHQFVLHQRAVSEEPCMHTHTHLQKNHAWTYTRARTSTHGCTITCPTSSVTSKAHSPSWYLPVNIHVHTHLSQTYTRAHTHIACYPPKHSQHVNPAWKLVTGHVPWQPHPDFEPVRWDMCGTLTQWQRSYWSSDLIKKGGLASLPSLAPKALKTQSNLAFLSVMLWLFPLKILTGHDQDQQSQIRTRNLTSPKAVRLGVHKHVHP